MNDSKLPIDPAAQAASEVFVPSVSPAQRLPGAAEDASVGDRPAVTEQPADGPADIRADTLTPEAVAMYRARLARGYYGTPMVMRALAERLLESGDL